MAKNEAVLMAVNCISAHRTFYARYDFAYDGVWVLSYGLKTPPADASSGFGSGGMTRIDISKSRTGPQYKCPYCGNTQYVRCGACKKLTCWSGHGSFTCDHCGHSGEVRGHIDTLEGDRRHSQ